MTSKITESDGPFFFSVSFALSLSITKINEHIVTGLKYTYQEDIGQLNKDCESEEAWESMMRGHQLTE